MPFVGSLRRILPADLPPADLLPAGTASYFSVAPSRLAETRASEGPFGFVRVNANTVRVQVAGRNGVPANATAAVLNVTVTNVTAASYVTVYPAGTSLPMRFYRLKR